MVSKVSGTTIINKYIMNFKDLEYLFIYYDKYEIWTKVTYPSNDLWTKLHKGKTGNDIITMKYKGRKVATIERDMIISSIYMPSEEFYRLYILPFIREIKIEGIVD